MVRVASATIPWEKDMPVYEYQCSNCVNQFTALGSISHYQSPATCPECGELSPRIFNTAPRLNTMSPGRRKAFQVNEKSAHEPGVRNKHHCGSSCGCGTSKTASKEASAPKIKQQNGKRPWMLGH